MKEILYLHASTGYLAAHFFNAQESYFSYDERTKEVDDSIVDPNISFSQSQTPDGSIVSTPRSLIFDYKAKFGSLSHINALHVVDENIAETDAITWNGAVTEHRQEPIPQSTYHAGLEASEYMDTNSMTENATETKDNDSSSSVRFWSDFSRVFYHPRGLHRVPDLADWERETGWASGIEKYKKFDYEHEVLEESFRNMAENCDLLQGVQLAVDAVPFGSFTTALLMQLRDEYAKLPLLTFCSLSPFDAMGINMDNAAACMSAMNDALTLYELGSLSTITVPLSHPSTWQRGKWDEYINADFNNPYHSSAILSAQIESITLPLRLKSSISSSTDIASYCSQLNWRGDTPFVALNGAFPISSTVDNLNLRESIFDFSHPAALHKKNIHDVPFSQREVFRGLDHREKAFAAKWVEEEHVELREPLRIASFIDLSYPIPSSYPQFFTHLDSCGRRLDIHSSDTRVRSVSTYASLTATPRTGKLAKPYAQLSEGLARRTSRIIDDLGVERDIVREVGEMWWSWVGAYGGEEGEEDVRGEDDE
ncbi:tubulin domain-containing protein [Hysterangium stoloniferum]|nr:tubulin domain-containing protein [Hysterangium stoloniferum]